MKKAILFTIVMCLASKAFLELLPLAPDMRRYADREYYAAINELPEDGARIPDFENGDIDLMILHHSQPSNDVDAYQAMERAVEAGKLRSIGLSNYYEPEDFDRVVNATTIRPALLQNETHRVHQDECGHQKDSDDRRSVPVLSGNPGGPGSAKV